ncbi:MAG TPA: molybdopterin-guanine dinucleotide biosynthesis protein B [Longimicrobiaceae bacterium]|nr:molybdopterin-guanine dinucleotide biosynthesis protein B [Longimicrobiaceae bacterium]
MRRSDLPPVLSIVGKKNSGKTTLLVALCAELGRRGYRIATVKHGHHAFEIDHPGRDSWRHFHEGGAEAVLMVAAGKVALMRRLEGEPDPEALILQHYAGGEFDLVLVEGYKHGPFSKLEIFRRGQHERPVYDPSDAAAAALFLAIVSDDPALEAACEVIPLDSGDPAGSHVQRLAALVEERVLSGSGHAA